MISGRELVPEMQTVRISWGLTRDGCITDPLNHAFCLVVRYSRGELINGPWTLIRPDIRPGGVSAASDLEAKRQYLALLSGSSQVEYVNGWFQANQARGGGVIEVVGAVVTWNVGEQRWEGYADVSVDFLPTGPQYLTPLDRVPFDQYLHSKRVIREVAREVIQQEMFDNAAEARTNHTTSRKRRSDAGGSKLYPDKAVFEPKLKQALGGQWLPNEEKLIEDLTIGSRGGLLNVLTVHGYRRPGEKLLACLRRLVDEWYPRQ